MSFYTLIFDIKNSKKWIIRSILSIFITIAFLFGFNYIIDPYNMTPYNLLNINYKFARDDRTEKVNFFKTLPAFDNILLGSSRVYSINPRIVSKLISGTTYNFGVGTATVEDHLGILLYLQQNHKLPKKLIVGIDFYTFNPDTPPNSYFLSNKELNFLSYKNRESEYWSKFLSLDATRASIKTFKKHLKNNNEKPIFDNLGWGGTYQDDTKRNLADELPEIKSEIEKNKTLMYSNFKYTHLDKKRIAYYQQIRKICKDNNITLLVFGTPLNPILLAKLQSYPQTKNAFNEFVYYLSSFDNFTNFYNDHNFTNNLYNFNGATHTSANAGDVIIKKVLKPIIYKENNQ